MKILLQHLSAFLLNNPELSQYHYPISQRVWEAEEHEGQNCWEYTDFQIPDKGFWASHLSVNFALCRAFAYPKHTSQVLSVSAQHPCNTGLNLDIQKEFGFWDLPGIIQLLLHNNNYAAYSEISKPDLSLSSSRSDSRLPTLIW